MNIVRNILAVILGAVIGSIVNGALIAIGPNVIPTPAGFDPKTMESFASTAHLLQPVNFIFPFIAHAGGTFAGSLAAIFIAASNRKAIAAVIGVLFLVGGILASVMIPAPVWFVAVDLLFAYIPMAFLGYKLAGRQ